MPQKMAELLAVEETRKGVLTNNEASSVLRTAFRNVEEALDFPYEVVCFLFDDLGDQLILFASFKLLSDLLDLDVNLGVYLFCVKFYLED